MINKLKDDHVLHDNELGVWEFGRWLAGKAAVAGMVLGNGLDSLERVEFEALATSTSSHKDGVEDRW